MIKRSEYLQALAEQEEFRGREAIRAGDALAADRALERARKLRRIAYLRAAAARYQRDDSLNPEQEPGDVAPGGVAAWPAKACERQ